MKLTGIIAAALAAGSMCAVATSGVAQTTPKANAQSAAARPSPSTQPAGYQLAPSADDSADDATNWAPVLKVTGVELLRSTRPPELDIIRVRGISSTDAWEGPELVPITRGPTADGILDLMFVAKAPTGAVNPSGFGAVEAIFVVDHAHPYKGFRVRGATNSLTLRQFPGYTEVPAPTVDCTSCVGKLFVAKGASMPAGKAAADVVREEDMPATLRVVKSSEGIQKFDADPNRLTLLLGDDGRIVLAVWE